MKNKSFYEAVAVLVGTIIGAGILGIPYVVAQAGFLTGTITMIVIGFALIMLNLYLGEISLRTKGIHQLTGYAEIYLGKWGKRGMAAAMILGIYGALIAYLLGVGQSINAIFPSIKMVWASIGFFIIMALLVYSGLKYIRKSELYINILVIAIVLFIFFAAIGKFNLGNLASLNLTKLFLPYGVILFAFIGAAAIPEVEEILKSNKKQLKKAIIFGGSIPLIIYFIFSLAVVAVTGLDTTQIATIGLGKILGQYMVITGNLFAVLTMTTSFLALGLALVWMYRFDYKMKKTLAFTLTMIIPLAIALSNVTDFIHVLGISGALAGGLEGILIVLMHRKAKTKGQMKPAYIIKDRLWLSILLILMFIGGIIYTLATL